VGERIQIPKNWEALPGKPDIVITKYKICVFVDSEFFHGKGFSSGYESHKYGSLEEQLRHSNNSEFWLNKIKRNMERDKEVTADLNGLGWTVLRFWSKDVLRYPDKCIKAIQETIFNNSIAE
jgi:DNA mismatch endonuclease (patch repair protein)